MDEAAVSLLKGVGVLSLLLSPIALIIAIISYFYNKYEEHIAFKFFNWQKHCVHRFNDIPKARLMNYLSNLSIDELESKFCIIKLDDYQIAQTDYIFEYSGNFNPIYEIDTTLLYSSLKKSDPSLIFNLFFQQQGTIRGENRKVDRYIASVHFDIDMKVYFVTANNTFKIILIKETAFSGEFICEISNPTCNDLAYIYASILGYFYCSKYEKLMYMKDANSIFDLKKNIDGDIYIK